jgi:amidase
LQNDKFVDLKCRGNGTTPVGSTLSYASFVSNKDALRNARFGLPWKRVWETAAGKEDKKEQYESLIAVVQRLREAGAEVVEWTDFPSAEEIIPPTGWDWYVSPDYQYSRPGY